MALGEVIVLAPQCLTSTGEGLLSFVLRLENLDIEKYSVQFAADIPPSTRDTRLKAMAWNGLASLILPGNLHGETPIRVELFDRLSGRRFVGAFTLSVQSLADSGTIIVNTGNQAVRGNAVNYQPIEVRGGETRPVESVEDLVRVHVPLREEHLEDPVSIGELMREEQLVVLSSVPPIRVLDLHIGAQLVVGRCHRSDLQKETAAWDRLRQACTARSPSVDWVTVWDDVRFNRLLAVLSLEPEQENFTLQVENPTDYSRSAARSLAILVNGEALAEVKPGGSFGADVAPDEEIILGIRYAGEVLEFLRIVIEEVETAGVIVPVVRTFRSRFRWSLEGTAAKDREEIHFLGLWIPRSSEEIKKILKRSTNGLWVSFPEEDDLGLEIDWSRRLHVLTVAGTVNLRSCLGGG